MTDSGSRLAKKVALVTGGSKGIGLAVAEAILERGGSVAICARNGAEVEAVGRSLETRFPKRVLARGCDVRREGDVEALFAAVDERFGGIDILVNNAGVGFFKNLEKMTLEEWNTILETNVTGVFLCCRAAVPRMRARGGGYIVNLSSLAGKNAFPQATAYNASKFALNGMSEALMQEVRHDGIRVSYVMPGSVNTYFNSGTPDASMSWQLQPEDIARVVVDLLGHDARSLPSCVEIRPSMPPKK
ncbi:MAG TPA: SDR family oxidoreductase [Candidatus Eisenbacteria bacterium]|nr:SDR family oxidoreductase [Candidatus Eisenbacteria bacterium]